MKALLISAALAVVAAPLGGQQFGTSVAVADGDVLVLKPSVGRGPAGVYVFRQSEDGEWTRVDRLTAMGAAESGEGLSASLAMAGNTVLVGSGDPRVSFMAHTFHRRSGGGWTDGIRVPLGAGGTTEEVPTDWASIASMLSPPQRVVSANGNRMAVAVVGGGPETVGLRILERQGGSDGWVLETVVRPSAGGANDQFGVSIALRSDRVLVGAPRHGESGAVFFFARDSTGTWGERAIIVPTDSTVSRFGAEVTWDGDLALIGAPGTPQGAGGFVAVYAADSAGAWSEMSRITPDSMPADGLFGAEFALMGDELWVGAPLYDQNRGRIHRFVRDGVMASWRAAPGEAIIGPEPNYVLGASIALSRELAAAGAPAAYGGTGRVAVFMRQGAAWSAPEWLTLGGDLELVAGEEIACAEGDAAGFDCNNVDLQAFLPLAAMGASPGERVSDIWGWTDPMSGKEYALVGRTAGAAFVDITNPTDPQFLGMVPANPSGARDLKVYRDHLFFTGDGAGNHGLIVFNLAHLRDVTDAPVTFEPDARYDGIASAHNLIIDTDAGFAYPVGASGGGQTCGGGLHMVNIQDPLNPTFAGCYTDTEGLIWQGRTHDGQCVIYEGPDQRYHGREICFASNETALRIVDVTDKENPEPLAAATYPGLAYVHQGWLSDDQRFFYLDDELDELVGQTDRTRTLVWDIAELDDPVLVTQYLGPDGATDHNLYVKGNRMYQANYQAGFRLVDVSQPENPVEIGHFDTTPYEGNPPGFNGAWTAFPFFESGTVIVSSMNEGLFVLKPRPPVLMP